MYPYRWTSVLLSSLAVLAGVAGGSLARAAENASPGAPPETRRGDEVVMRHGASIPDPYRWLESDEAPAVVDWDRAQEAYLRAAIAGSPGREQLAELIERELDLPGGPTLPHFEGDGRYFLHRPAGANLPILYRAPVDGLEEPVVLLDPNGWSAAGTEGIEGWAVSPTERHLAYRRASHGSEDTTLCVRDLSTGEDLPDRIPRTKFSPVVWTRDGSGFYYTRLPDPALVPPGEAQYHRRVYFHPLGGLPADDPVIYGAGRPRIESMWVYRGSDRTHLFLARGMPYEAMDTFQLVGSGPTVRMIPIVVGEESRTSVDRVGNLFVFLTDKHSDRRGVYTAPVLEDGRPGAWSELKFPQGDTAVIENLDIVADRHAVCLLREDVISRLWVRPVDGAAEAEEIPVPGPGSVNGVAHRPGDPRLTFLFESYHTPPTLFVCDLDQRPLASQSIESTPTTLPVGELLTERFFCSSKDGTRIPVFVLRRADAPTDGSAPLVLHGYGGFRVMQDPRFSRVSALWATLGGRWAVACIRGGFEYGEAWHEAGALAHKQNVFDDFVSAADWLVESGRVRRQNLALHGGSNGGLLVAACVNQRPDLCRAAVAAVPLTDMLRYHLFQYARSWTRELGDPEIPEEFAWLRAYSPVHNVKMGASYPAVLVTAGLHDGRVNAFHARKIVAAWQHATRGPHPIYLHIDRDSGHGAASLKQAREEILIRLAFLAQELGLPLVPEPAPAARGGARR